MASTHIRRARGCDPKLLRSPEQSGVHLVDHIELLEMIQGEGK